MVLDNEFMAEEGRILGGGFTAEAQRFDCHGSCVCAVWSLPLVCDVDGVELAWVGGSSNSNRNQINTQQHEHHREEKMKNRESTKSDPSVLLLSIDDDYVFVD